jgi:hypothetical protein
MIRSAASKVMWVGRATVFMVGLAVILALVFGVVSMAAAHTGSGGFFHLNHNNPVTALSKLTGNLSGAVLKVDNNGPGPALSLEVNSGKAPLSVNSTAGKATNLNADKLDALNSTDFQRAKAAAGGDLTGNYPNPQIAAGAVGAAELERLPAVRATFRGSGSQTIPHTHAAVSDTLLQFPSEDFDQVGAGQRGEMHRPFSSRLKAPRDGIYHIEVQVGWTCASTGCQSDAVGVRTAFLSKNEGLTSDDETLTFDRVNASETGAAYNHFGTDLALKQGDYVEVRVGQSSGVLMEITDFTFASMHYVGPR